MNLTQVVRKINFRILEFRFHFLTEIRNSTVKNEMANAGRESGFEMNYSQVNHR